MSGHSLSRAELRSQEEHLRLSVGSSQKVLDGRLSKQTSSHMEIT